MFWRFSIFAPILVVVQCQTKFQEMFSWEKIDYTWPCPEAKEKAISESKYHPTMNSIQGIKIWKGQIYLSIPRYSSTVPVSLARTPTDEEYVGVRNPNLVPFPNWEMQEIGNCSAFQHVPSMEIDPRGRMWVLDSGRVNTRPFSPEAKCPPRLLILDLENNGAILRSHEFPEDVAHKGTVDLGDIVLDHEDGGHAYITDKGQTDPGIIVFSLKNNTSRKVRHQSMKKVNGIALSPASVTEKVVYYTAERPFHLHSIPAALLRNRSDNVQHFVRDFGEANTAISTSTYILGMSATGVLYCGMWHEDQVAFWETLDSSFFATMNYTIIAREHKGKQMPKSFGFDEDGYLWYVTLKYSQEDYSRFGIVRYNAASKNYQYYQNGSAPALPEIQNIPAGAEKVRFAFATFLTVLSVLIMRRCGEINFRNSLIK